MIISEDPDTHTYLWAFNSEAVTTFFRLKPVAAGIRTYNLPFARLTL